MPRDGRIRHTPDGETRLAFTYHVEARPARKGKKTRDAKDIDAPIRSWAVLSQELVERAGGSADPLGELAGTEAKGDVAGDRTATTLHTGPAFQAPDPAEVEKLNARCPLAPAAATATAADKREQRERERARKEAEETKRRAQMAAERQAQIDREDAAARDFHNPYAFVPAPPRNVGSDRGLGDAEPLGHDRYAPNALSGRLTVRLRVVTPLLIPDHAIYAVTSDAAKEHGFYDVRTTPDGDPDLGPTSLKGMLRSAFEAITNSRMSVFGERGPLTRRLVFGETENLKPVRVTVGDGGAIQIEEMKRARLPYYGGEARKYPDEGQPKHGDAVKISTVGGGSAGPKVETIEALPRPPKQTPSEGWVLVTGRPPGNRNKLHEAVLTHTGTALASIADEELGEAWRAVIDSYVEARTQPGAIETAGRHAQEGHQDLRRLVTKEHGLLCYAQVVDGVVRSLLPTRVSRTPFPARPIDVLPDSVRPADVLPEGLPPADMRKMLSPADRVFGWVGEERYPGSAHRGQLTIRAPRMTAEPERGAIRSFRGAPVPLAILSAPKPQQALFYAARDDKGTAPPDGEVETLRELALSDQAHGLRGRKVYPQQPHWADGFGAAIPVGEFRRAGDRRDKQNRSVLGWVNPGTEFTFEMDFVNLNRAELGGLVWLLSRPAGQAIAFGGGRPLGFGAVHLGLVEARAQTGAETERALRELRTEAACTQGPVLNGAQLEALEQDFLDAARDVSGSGGEQPIFLAAFERALVGFADGKPTHYPRTGEKPEVEGKNYEWFTRNADKGQFALPDLLDEIRGLPRKPR